MTDPLDELLEDRPQDAPAAPDAAEDPMPRRARARRQHREWRDGGSSTRKWGWDIVGWAVVALGAGIVASNTIMQLMGGTLGAIVATASFWLAMLIPVVVAYARSVPRGILALRPVDLLYAIVLGGTLRLVQGWLELAAGGSGAFPSYPSLDAATLFSDVFAPVVISPLLEEFFFRGLLLVALFTVVRRLARSKSAAGLGAILVTTGLFVLVHSLTATLAWDAVVSIALVGIVCGLLVVLTGRIWGAVLAHVVFNGSYVALALIGTLLGGASGGATLS